MYLNFVSLVRVVHGFSRIDQKIPILKLALQLDAHSLWCTVSISRRASGDVNAQKKHRLQTQLFCVFPQAHGNTGRLGEEVGIVQVENRYEETSKICSSFFGSIFFLDRIELNSNASES
jgi:hypothetical protein